MVPGLFITGSVTFGLGQMMQIVSAIRTRVLRGFSSVLVLVAGVAFIVCEAIPSGWGLYGVFLSAWLIYGALAIKLGGGSGYQRADAF
jgi:hypothetical protein